MPIRNLRDSPKIDLSGKTFGRWTVLFYSGNRSWKCRCECGHERSVLGHNLTRGQSESCGCLRRELSRARYSTHGMRHSPEWECWMAMRQRCNNPKAQAYANYGGRGIKVCDRWMQFENFIADMGVRPSAEHSLDRIDNDGNYEPNNCRWVTRIEQEHNKRSNHLLTYGGVTLPLAEMARRYGLLPGSLSDRLAYGWPLEKAITTPMRKRRMANEVN